MNELPYREGGATPEENIPRVSIPLVIIGGMTLLLLLSAFVPARWIGVKPIRKYRTPVDFNNLTVNSFVDDTNSDGSISWSELSTITNNGSSTKTLPQGVKLSPEVAKRLNDPNNITASFSKNLYVTSAFLKKNGITDAASQQEVVNRIAIDAVKKVTAKQYTYKDIIVAKSEDKASLKKYGNDIAKITSTVITQKNLTEDITALQKYTTKKDDTGLIVLAKDATRIEGLVTKLLTVNVPPSAALNHLLLVNQVESYSNTLYNLSQVTNDPIRAIVATQKYTDNIKDFGDTLQKIAAYFLHKNIVFSEGEAGHLFTVGYTTK